MPCADGGRAESLKHRYGGTIAGIAVYTPISGVLRGLTRSGIEVTLRTKVIEVDMRGDPAAAFGLGERPRRIAEGVLKALARLRVAEPV